MWQNEDCQSPQRILLAAVQSTLISISRLITDEYGIEFAHNGCTVAKPRSSAPLLTASLGHGVYCVDLAADHSVADFAMAAAIHPSAASLTAWHRRLGHVGKRPTHDMVRLEAVIGLRISGGGTKVAPRCIVCARKTITVASIPAAATAPELVADGSAHTDVCRPFKKAISGEQYFLLFNYRGHLRPYFLELKEEVPSKTTEYSLGSNDKPV